MSVKSEKLVKNIQEIQQFVAARSQQHESFGAIAQTLEKSVVSLQAGKLTLQIVSHNPNSATALHNLSRTCDLSAAYQFKVTPLTSMQLTQPEPTAALVLQTNALSQRYPLTTEKLAIGRHPECQILIPDSYVLVSGYHANIQPCEADSQQTYASWQICDLSRNGTYVNEQQVQGCQVLMEGDCITLGASMPTATSPELFFEYQPVVNSNHERVDSLVTDCDVLCWVVNPHTVLTAVEQQFLEKISTARFTNLLVIADSPDSLHQPAQAAELHRSIHAWLQSISLLDVFWLPLNNLQPDTSAPQLNAAIQQEIDKFFKVLQSLVKRKPEDILARRLTTQVLAQLSLVESLLDLDEKKLVRSTQRDAAKLKQPGQTPIKEKVDVILRQIQDEKATFFKQAKDKLKQSKVDLLDDYLENSISYKIRRFVDQLKPHIVKYRGRKYIQLRFSTIEVVEPKGAKRKPLKPETVEERAIDANTALMNFCRSELSWWADEEWEMLCLSPQNSLRELLKKAYEMLHSMPSVDLNRSLFQPEQSIDSQTIFEEAFAMPLSESRYREASPMVYMLKKIRSQWMQFIFMFSFLSMVGVASRRQIMQHILAPIVNAFKVSPYVSTVVLLVVLYFLFRFFTRLYREDRDLEREKEAEKIRNNLRSYYQALAKNRLVEKLVQNLTTALEVEEGRVEKILQVAKHQTAHITTETERNQAPIRKRILEYEVLQKELRSDRDKLQKLKKSLDLRSS